MTVGDELKVERLKRGLTQHEVAEMVGVNRNFVYEMELGHHTNTIYALHKAYMFLGYVPKTLKIDETTLRGQIFIHRIKHGLTYSAIAKEIGIDKSTVARFEQGKNIKQESVNIISHFFSKTNY